MKASTSRWHFRNSNLTYYRRTFSSAEAEGQVKRLNQVTSHTQFKFIRICTNNRKRIPIFQFPDLPTPNPLYPLAPQKNSHITIYHNTKRKQSNEKKTKSNGKIKSSKANIYECNTRWKHTKLGNEKISQSTMSRIHLR